MKKSIVNKLKKFPQIQGIVNYSVTGLNQEQYSKAYLELCDIYNRVEHHANFNIFNGKMQGYILCQDKIKG